VVTWLEYGTIYQENRVLSAVLKHEQVCSPHVICVFERAAVGSWCLLPTVYVRDRKTSYALAKLLLCSGLTLDNDICKSQARQYSSGLATWIWLIHSGDLVIRRTCMTIHFNNKLFTMLMVNVLCDF